MHPPAPSPRGHKQPPIRRWRIPPPPVVRTPEGAAILQEVPAPLAAVLWRTVRSITLWADVPPAGRDSLFNDASSDRRRAAVAAANPPPALAKPLQELALILADPSRIDGVRVARSAACVARWAETCGYDGTAAAFCEAAARALPADAASALAAGRTAWRLGEASVADAWLQRAVGYSRRTKEWDAYIGAHLICAEILAQRGEDEAAERYVARARRRASRPGGGGVEAMEALFSAARSDPHQPEAALEPLSP